MNLFGVMCHACNAVFQLEGSDDPNGDAGLTEQLFSPDAKCPLCGGHFIPMTVPREGGQRVTPLQLWNMISGLGNPEEIVRSSKQVEDAIRGRTITGFALGETPNGRCIVTSLVLDSGKELHFAVGYGEAVIYKITDTIKEK